MKRQPSFLIIFLQCNEAQLVFSKGVIKKIINYKSTYNIVSIFKSKSCVSGGFYRIKYIQLISYETY